MRKSALRAVFLFALCVSPAVHSQATTIKIANADFEQTDPADKTKPAGWSVDGKAVELVLDGEKKHRGAQSLRVKFKEGVPYAGVIQRLDLKEVRGKTLKVSAWFARGADDAMVGVWLGAWDKDKKRIAYANTYETDAAKKRAWTQHSMTIDIPASAESGMVGVAIYDKDGVMWADDVEVSVIAKVKMQ